MIICTALRYIAITVYIPTCTSVTRERVAQIQTTTQPVCVQVLPELSTAEAKDKFPKGVEVYKVPSEREYMRFVRRAPRPPAPWLPRAAATERTYKYTASDSCATLLSADTRPTMSSAAGMRVSCVCSLVFSVR